MPTNPRPVGSLLLFLVTLFVPVATPAATQSAEAPDDHAVQFAMKNVMYHYSDSVVVRISELQGELLPVKPGSIVIFDDKNSFTISLFSAEIAINCTSLAQVLNQNVFSSADSPIKNLTIQTQNDRLIVKGKFHLKGDVPFEAIGILAADHDGKIRLRTEHVKAAHLPLKGVFDLLGIELAQLINTNKVHGVTVDKDDLILDPEHILPPPHIKGKVTAVRIQGSDVVQVFGARQASNFAAKQPGNYMAFRHGEMRFGKLTMHDADLIMIDMDPRDPFDFYLDYYQEQLVAGYTKSTREYGLRTYTRDFNKLPKRTASKPTK